MAKLFISYRRKDTEQIAGRIHDRLESHFGGGTVFYDVDSIPAGIDYRQHINQTIKQCSALLALIGEEWSGKGLLGQSRLLDPNDPVRAEIELALENEVMVIPVPIGQARMPEEKDLPSSLAKFPYLEDSRVDPGRDFDHHVNRLIQRLDELVSEHRFVNGTCAQCGCSQIAVEHFKWTCPPETKKPDSKDKGSPSIQPITRKLKSRTTRPARTLDETEDEIKIFSNIVRQVPKQLLVAPVLTGSKKDHGNALAWTPVTGAGSYLLQRSSHRDFLSGAVDLYEGQQMAFVDPLGGNSYKVSLSPVRTWHLTLCYRVKAQRLSGIVADSPWSEIIEL